MLSKKSLNLALSLLEQEFNAVMATARHLEHQLDQPEEWRLEPIENEAEARGDVYTLHNKAKELQDAILELSNLGK